MFLLKIMYQSESSNESQKEKKKLSEEILSTMKSFLNSEQTERAKQYVHCVYLYELLDYTVLEILQASLQLNISTVSRISKYGS